MNWVGQVLFGCYIKYKEVITIASRDGYLSIIALDISALFIVTTLMAMLGEKKCIMVLSQYSGHRKCDFYAAPSA